MADYAEDEPVVWPSICGNASPAFWDNQVSWNTSDPNVPECFRKTALVWIPCAIFWLFVPLEVYEFRFSRGWMIPWSLLNVTKLVLNGALIVVNIFNLSRLLGSPLTFDSSDLIVDLLTSVFLLLTVGAVFILVYVERIRGVRSSALLFFYWLTYLICGFVTIYGLSKYDFQALVWSEKLDVVSFVIIYAIVVVQFILSCRNDVQALHISLEDTLDNACPRNTASFLSKVFFLWFDRLLWKGYSSHLEAKDVWKSPPETLACHAYPDFMERWTKRKKVGKMTSLAKTLTARFFWLYVFITILKILEYGVSYSNPILLKWLIEFVSSKEPYWHGYLYVSLMFLVACTASVASWQSAYFACVIQVTVQSALSSAIYRKSLTMSGSSRRHCTTGEIVNMMAVDLFNITDFLFRIIDGLTIPLQIGLGIYMMYAILGNATFAGIVTMVLLKVISGYLAKKMEWLQETQLELKDQRVKQINEAILGIKVLKLFAWEIPFMRRIEDIRLKETNALRYGMYYEGAATALWIIVPAMVTLVSLVSYVLMDEKNVLDASKIFVTFSIVQLLGSSFIRVPYVIVSFVKAVVSTRRLNEFLNNPDLDPDCVTHDANSEYPIKIEMGSFTWGPESEMELKNVNLKVKDGSLVAIVGPVGCGKSSLISAMLGEMEKTSGTVNTRGKVAYVPQQAWIQNTTLKENILFGNANDDAFYDKVVQSCALIPDFEILPGGDLTEIGENGINLSGGQKQRISLARSVYNDADIYLLDDPLSAVDSHVGQHIFEHVIGPTGLLKNKTRVLVTHGLTYLPYVDYVVVISKGAISEIGTYNELIEIKGDFADFIDTYGQQANGSSYKEQTGNEDKTKIVEETKSVAGLGTTLIADEHVEVGEVSSSIYKLYIKYVGYGLSSLSVILLMIAYSFNAGAQNWLSVWSSDLPLPDGSQDVDLRNLRLGVYGALVLFFGIFMLLSVSALIQGARSASMRFHSSMLNSVLHSPMSFFDTTPSGRIVNRFSEDMQSVDEQVPFNFRDFITAFMEILAAAFVICIRLPIVSLFIIPMIFLYCIFQRFFIRTINQLRRLESVAKSPLYSRFSETIAGVATIRAFRLQREFIDQFEERIDEVVKYQYYRRTMFRWFGIRLDTMGGLLTFVTGIFAIINRDTLTPGTVALVVSYSMSVFWIFSWLIISAGELESSVVSVERIHEYISLKQEAEWDIPERQPPAQWPPEGAVSFRNFATRYREELQPVLHDFTCNIIAGEKIGVVGRTGAGKSSVTMSLFRIIEALRGQIIIDGVDISSIGLHHLRSKLTIIPQDPVLFSGSLRLNLDPFDRHSDSELWKALDLAHLKDFASSLVCGLMHHVTEGGSNLSAGQRQLVCLARCLLRKTKILVLDEATAAVDLETDDLIQTTIRKEFADCTVLTIAHRLNTIMDSTRVIILDRGRVVEFDTPENLLNDRSSAFYSMARQTGLVN